MQQSNVGNDTAEMYSRTSRRLSRLGLLPSVVLRTKFFSHRLRAYFLRPSRAKTRHHGASTAKKTDRRPFKIKRNARNRNRRKIQATHSCFLSRAETFGHERTVLTPRVSRTLSETTRSAKSKRFLRGRKSCLVEVCITETDNSNSPSYSTSSDMNSRDILVSIFAHFSKKNSFREDRYCALRGTIWRLVTPPPPLLCGGRGGGKNVARMLGSRYGIFIVRITGVGEFVAIEF